ncbi:MAG TPA: S8 family serine peptidase [Thermoanaerobaculia bacterium]|nr:S8 family serine peptidase [Thermoanaerobaculia bacterium]
MRVASTRIPVFGLIIALSGATLVADGRQGWTKVVIESEGRQLDAENDIISRHSGELLRAYEQYRVLRFPNAALAAVDTDAKARGISVRREDQWDDVAMPRGRVDTRKPVLPSTGLLASYPSNEGLYVIQFVGPLVPEFTNLLADRGLTYISYVPYNAVLVTGSSEAVRSAGTSPFVQWTSLYHPAFRDQPETLTVLRGERRYTVQFANVPGSEASISRLLALSPKSPEVLSYGKVSNYTLELSAASVARLLRDPYVIGVEERGIIRTSGERESLALTGLPLGDPYRPWVNNNIGDQSNYKVAVADYGYSTGKNFNTLSNHPDVDPSRITWKDYVDTSVDGSAEDTDGHGTAVAGIALGNPTGSPFLIEQYEAGLGVAFTAKLFVQKIITAPENPALWLSDAKLDGATVQSQSRNEYREDSPAGAYTTLDQAYDAAIRTHDLPLTNAVGNIYPPGFVLPRIDPQPGPNSNFFKTLVLSPATAKNVISVGGSENYRPNSQYENLTCNQGDAQKWNRARNWDNLAYLSRRNTNDQRIKPELIAPAQLVSSSYRSPGFPRFCFEFNDVGGNLFNDYMLASGTSFASPQVAGAIVLLNRRFQSQFPSTAPMSAAMAKAALIGMSRSMKRDAPSFASGGMDGYYNPEPGAPEPNVPEPIPARPNNVGQGYGRLSLADAVNPDLVHTFLPGTSASTGFLAPLTASGTSRTATFTAQRSDKPVIITLAWNDEPGLPNSTSYPDAAPTLVNNLDLKIIGGCSFGYQGNRFLTNGTEYSMNVGCFGGVADVRNNSEIIVLPAGAVTTFDVRVLAYSISTTQPFSIYVQNALKNP